MGIDVLDIIFLPIIFLIAAITSYQDFRDGKIKNKWIILGLVLGLGIYLLFVIFNLVGYGNIFSPTLSNTLWKGNWLNFLRDVFLNSFCAIVLSFLLWYFKLWSAGDAKLFFVFSFLLPLKYYFSGYIFVFPSVVLFINVFSCAFLFLLVISLLGFLKVMFFKFPGMNFKDKFAKLQSKLKEASSSIFNIILALTTIFLIAKTISEKLLDISQQASGIFAFNMAVILLIMIFMKKILKIFKKFNKIIIGILIIYFGCILLFAPGQIKSILFFILKIGAMFLIFFMVFAVIISCHIRIAKKINMPFAIWLTLGTIITIFLKGSILSFLKPLFN